MAYTYKHPVKDRGMRRIKVPRKLLADIYPKNSHYKFSIMKFIFTKNVHYISQDNSTIIEEHLYRIFAPFVAWLLFPIYVLMYGFSNIKEINNEILDMLYQRTRGSFTLEQFTKKYNAKGYEAIIKYLKTSK